MRKVIFYLPALIFSTLYGMIAISDIGPISPIVIVWLVLLFISGFMLNKDVYWGSLAGALPAMNFIYMGTQDTGQMINEMPVGIVLLIFYIVCGYVVYRGNKQKKIFS